MYAYTHINFITGPLFTTDIFYAHYPWHYNPCTTTFYLLKLHTYPQDNLLTFNLTKTVRSFNLRIDSDTL
jgi:hypothetical protein